MDKVMQEIEGLTKLESPEVFQKTGPKAWGECSHDEREELLEQLRALYIQNGLLTAKIDLQQQIGLNLMKNGTRSSEDEFLFSENLFSVKQQEAVERFSQTLRQLQRSGGAWAKKYDDSTIVIMNDSGYVEGDELPDIRGLMHIKDEVEQKAFSESRANLFITLWSTQSKELPQYLEIIDNLAHEKVIQTTPIAINTDRVFLYNEAIQKILIDKVNTRFLRDTSFSDVNNLFSTRYVRNLFSADSNTPFVIITDSKGKIAFAEPIKEKQFSKLATYVQNIKEGKPAHSPKKPFVHADEQQFTQAFDEAVTEFGTLAYNSDRGLDLLQKFEWRGMTAIHLRQVGIDKKQAATHKATIMINIRAKGKYMDDFLEHTELEKLITLKWSQKPGFYFRLNKQTVPTVTVKLQDEIKCKGCSKVVENGEPVMVNINDATQGQIRKPSEAYCFPCSQKELNTPLLYLRVNGEMDNYFDTISDSTFITKESALKAAAEVKRAAKTPTIAVQCDECNKQFKEGDRFKCAECSNFDLCKDCFVTHEIELKATQEEVGGHLTGGKHPFYIVRNFQDYVENFKL